MVCSCSVVFCLKQKTAYEMRISDWSSDVCSADLPADAVMAYRAIIDSGKEVEDVAASFGVSPADVRRVLKLSALHPTILKAFQNDEIGMGSAQEIGRESCRVRVSQYVEISLVRVYLKQIHVFMKI